MDMKSFSLAGKFQHFWNGIRAKLSMRAFLAEPWKIALIILFLFLMVKSVAVASTSTFSFDGGMNVQAAQNLLRNFSYATSYDSLVMFDPVIQTGIPVILPVAVLFLLFGESFTAGLMINAIYLLLLLAASTWYLKKSLKLPGYLVLLAVLFLLGTPQIFDLGFGLYGEIPMLFYLVMTLIFLQRNESSSGSKSIFIAGIFLGLGFLTKTVILIVVPALFLAFLYDFLVKRRLSPGVYFKQWGLFIAGFLIPVAAFEIFKLVSLGFPAYVAWWRSDYLGILQEAGVGHGFTDTAGLWDKLAVHLDLLASYLKQPLGLLVTLLLVVLILFVGIVVYGVITRRRKGNITGSGISFLFSNHFLVLIMVTLSYFGWWLLITTTTRAWYRRIFVGNILLEVCLVSVIFLLYFFIKKLIEQSKYKNNRWFLPARLAVYLLLLAVSLLGITRTGNYKISFADTKAKTATLAAAEFIQRLPPEAEFHGYGWWQAPNIAFESGTAFKNIYFSSEAAPGAAPAVRFLVLDEYSHGLAQDEYREILRNYLNRIVFSRSPLLIYQLYAKAPTGYPGFTEREKEQVGNNRIDFLSTQESAVFTRNVYMEEDNVYGKWAQQVSGYLLRYDGEKTLSIVFVVPELDQYDSQPVTLDIVVNKEQVETFDIVEPGLHRLDIPLNDLDSTFIEVTLACSAKLSPAYASRELSVFMVLMELLK